MKATFIGMNNDAMAFAKLIHRAKDNQDENTIKINGILCKSVEYTTQAAVMFNVKAYLNLESAVNDSDILFIGKIDQKLAQFSDILKSNSVRNKILCHFSRKYDSTILSCGTTNSCYSISFPYAYDSDAKNDFSDTLVLVEGGGKRNEEFEEAMRCTLPKVVFRNKDNKKISKLSSRMCAVYLNYFINRAIHLYKISGIYDEECFKRDLPKYITKVVNGQIDIVPKLDANEIKSDMRLLSSINYSDTRELYRDMETHILNDGTYSFEEKESIMRILKYKR